MSRPTNNSFSFLVIFFKEQSFLHNHKTMITEILNDKDKKGSGGGEKIEKFLLSD